MSLLPDKVMTNAPPPSGALGEVWIRGEFPASGWPTADLHRFLPVRHVGAGLGLPAPVPRVQTGAGLLRRLISFNRKCTYSAAAGNTI